MSQIKYIHTPTERFLYLLLITHIILISHIVLMTLKGGTSACAACKYQRRRCAADCPLAPYFPAEQPKLFQNVHRLFGVRSIVKILENLDEAQKPEAMKSIIFQSYVRERSPIHGCLGLTQQLQYMIYLAEEEMKTLNTQLQFYRPQQNQNNHNQNMNQETQEDVTSQQLDLGMGLNVNHNQSNVTPFFSPLLPISEQPQPQQQQQQQMSYTTYSYNETNNNNNGYMSPPPPYNNTWDHNRFGYNHDGNGFNDPNEIKSNNNNGVMGIESQLVNLQMVTDQKKEEEEESDHEYDEIHQFLEMIDDRQSFVDSKEPYASSSVESLKEHTDESGGNELRSAANCFTLTSANKISQS